jgi:hypothetical protein
MGSTAEPCPAAVHTSRPPSPAPSSASSSGPGAGTPAAVVVYTRDPYSAQHPYRLVAAAVPSPSRAAVCPGGTLHAASLAGRVEFVEYPQLAPVPPSPCGVARPEMRRLFVGQLPYKVTDEQLDWVCASFGGARVHFAERITRDVRGRRQLTGCVHVYVPCDEDAARLVVGLHKRLLVDNTGVWYARTAAQAAALGAYTAGLKADRALRPAGMPYDSVVVQPATSTYDPAAWPQPAPAPVTAPATASERRAARRVPFK